VRQRGSKLGEPCPKVRLRQDRLAIEHLALVESQVRGKGSKLGEGECISQTNDISRCGISPTVMFELMLFRAKSILN
jgi:hypothetical protein